MDYSTTISEAENPAGPSPWGNSPIASPNRNAGAFPRDTPTSPAYGARQSSYSPGDAIGENGFGGPRSAGGASTSGDEERRPDTAESGTSEADLQQHNAQQQQQAPQQSFPPQQRHEPQRYHHNARQSQHPPVHPQYKLQAKITGLERVGRKDPILRFDVHVGYIAPRLFLG